MSKEQLKTLSDEDILAAAEQIIADEQTLQKSMMEPVASEPVKAEGEQSEDDKKKKELEKGCGEDMAMDVKKSQADIEGKETGGLAPSVQGNLGSDESAQGDSQDDANKKSKKHLMKDGDPAAEGGATPTETQQGDSQDEANKNSSKPDQKSEGGAKATETQSGSSQDEANKGQMFDLMKKSIVEISKAVKAINARLATLETTKPVETEQIQKSMQADTIETLAKSYNKAIRSLESENEKLQKSFSEQVQELKKSQDLLAKENQEFKAKLSKPARTRETATAFEAIQKGNSEQGIQPLIKSKGDALEKMEELRKSGKITGDELISFNASGHMTDNVKKHLGLKR